MQQDQATHDFLHYFKESLSADSFVKLTLSRPVDKKGDLRKVMTRIVEIKKGRVLSFTLRYLSRDEVKNFPFGEAGVRIEEWLGEVFLNADLFTLQGHYTLRYNKNRRGKLIVQPAAHEKAPPTRHDHRKKRLIDPARHGYLRQMGITGEDGKVVKRGQKKFRQINKYIEIIDALLQQQHIPDAPHIVDMGSGKGYLTFALYDYLVNNRQLHPRITGIELRQELVDFCNDLARSESFDGLDFLATDIHEYFPDRIDMLIALHACDIATDIAIAKGIQAGAEIIIVAPCCHKQVRKEMDGGAELQSILRHGILEERQAEIITDGIRSLLLEAHGYKTKVFEFISTDHTPKNLMITATKSQTNPEALAQVETIKRQFGIGYHYLERLLESSSDA